MIKIYCSLILFLLSFVAWAQDDSLIKADDLIDYENNDKKYQVSFLTLALNAEKFDSKKIYVSGYLSNKHGTYLFFDRNSCNDQLVANALEVSLDKKKFDTKLSKLQECDLVSMSGVYGYFDFYGKVVQQRLVLGFLDMNDLYDR